MKHFLVVHEVGHPIFHDHPSGSLLCPTFSATQQLLSENFRQMAKYFKVGSTMLAFHHDGCLYYCASSDEDENYPVLKRQLHLLRDFIAFLTADALTTAYSRVVSSLTPALRPIIKTISHLARTRQSFLVQGIETLEVNKELRDRCEDFLRAAWVRAPEQALHCLLFVNTKLATIHSRPAAFPLAAADIFLLSVYLESIVGSHIYAAAMAQSESAVSPLSASAPDHVTPFTGDSSGDIARPAAGIELTISAPSPSSPLSPQSGHDWGRASPPPPAEEGEWIRSRLPRSRLCYLRVSAISPYELRPFTLYVDEVYPHIYTIVVLDGRPEQLDADRTQQLTQAQAQFREAMVQLRDFFVIKERTPITLVHYAKLAPGLVHFLLVERTYGKFPNRVTCPAIGRLSTADTRRLEDLPGASSLQTMKKLLWSAICNAHDMQEAGFQETLRDLNGLHCHHKVWFEDEEASEQAIDTAHSQTLTTCPWALRDRLTNRRIRCYEFYGLFLGAMSAQSVAAGTRSLLAHLLDGHGRRRTD